MAIIPRTYRYGRFNKIRTIISYWPKHVKDKGIFDDGQPLMEVEKIFFKSSAGKSWIIIIRIVVIWEEKTKESTNNLVQSIC